MKKAQAAAVVEEQLDTDPFLRDVKAGLSSSPKRIPCKYFYDDPGSRLFQQICELPEYYLTRTELEIMPDCAREMASWIGPRVRLVEFGSGSSVKTRILLDALESPSLYIGNYILKSPKPSYLRRLLGFSIRRKLTGCIIDLPSSSMAAST